MKRKAKCRRKILQKNNDQDEALQDNNIGVSNVVTENYNNDMIQDESLQESKNHEERIQETLVQSCTTNVEQDNNMVNGSEYDESSSSDGNVSDKEEFQDHLEKEQEVNVDENKFPINALEENVLMEEELPEGTNELKTFIDPKYLGSMKWDLNGTVEEDAEDIYKNQPRIKSQILLQAATPIDIFLYLFPESLWCMITNMSNKYKEQQGITKKNITCEELMKYVGLLIARSMNPWTNGFRNHWRTRAEGIKI